MTSRTISQGDPPDLKTALLLHQGGQIDKAADIYRQILARSPADPIALHYLGLLEARAGKFENANSLMARSLELQPFNAQFRENYATILCEARRFESAAQICDDGLRSDPANVYLLYISAIALFKLKRLPDSLQRFDKLLAAQPDHLIAINERGSVLTEIKEYDQALAAFEKAIVLNPKFADAHLNIGNVLGALNRSEEAKSSFEKALALNPKLARAWSGLGNILRKHKLFDEALAAFDKALTLEPDLAEAWLGRGNVYTQLKQHDKAFAAYDRALSLEPDLAAAWLGRGNVYDQLKQHDNAFAAYDRALSLEPDLAAAWLGRGNVYTQLKQHDRAFAAYDRALSLEPDLQYVEDLHLHSKTHLCDWTELEAETARLLARVREGKAASNPFALLSLPCTVADQLQCAERYMKDLPVYLPVWLGESYSHDRIRIAYLSADFGNHPVAQLTAGLFEHHDKLRFEVTGISIGSADDSPLRRRLESAFEHFIDAEDKTDTDIAHLIRDREIDIAVDLMGHTMHSRLDILAQRAAPIQVNFLGYPATMGADWIDYIIADRTIIPAEHFQFYGECVVWLPHTYQANDDKSRIAERVPARAECGLPETAFVFCCFNNTFKINPQIFDVWMRLLAATANSVLWLLETNPAAKRNLRHEAERRAIDADRLIFAPRIAVADHLARHRQADLFLDTLPYNAHTTASDALWAGLPIVTCLGETFAGRVAASLLRAIGLPELVAESLKEYEALALKLAHDPAFLLAIKAKLARQREVYPLFDTARFTRHIDAAYVTMWERYQRGERPEAFTVAPIDRDPPCQSVVSAE